MAVARQNPQSVALFDLPSLGHRPSSQASCGSNVDLVFHGNWCVSVEDGRTGTSLHRALSRPRGCSPPPLVIRDDGTPQRKHDHPLMSHHVEPPSPLQRIYYKAPTSTSPTAHQPFQQASLGGAVLNQRSSPLPNRPPRVVPVSTSSDRIVPSAVPTHRATSPPLRAPQSSVSTARSRNLVCPQPPCTLLEARERTPIRCVSVAPCHDERVILSHMARTSCDRCGDFDDVGLIPHARPAPQHPRGGGVQTSPHPTQSARPPTDSDVPKPAISQAAVNWRAQLQTHTQVTRLPGESRNRTTVDAADRSAALIASLTPPKMSRGRSSGRSSVASYSTRGTGRNSVALPVETQLRSSTAPQSSLRPRTRSVGAVPMISLTGGSPSEAVAADGLPQGALPGSSNTQRSASLYSHPLRTVYVDPSGSNQPLQHRYLNEVALESPPPRRRRSVSCSAALLEGDYEPFSGKSFTSETALDLAGKFLVRCSDPLAPTKQLSQYDSTRNIEKVLRKVDRVVENTSSYDNISAKILRPSDIVIGQRRGASCRGCSLQRTSPDSDRMGLKSLRQQILSIGTQLEPANDHKPPAQQAQSSAVAVTSIVGDIKRPPSSADDRIAYQVIQTLLRPPAPEGGISQATVDRSNASARPSPIMPAAAPASTGDVRQPSGQPAGFVSYRSTVHRPTGELTSTVLPRSDSLEVKIPQRSEVSFSLRDNTAAPVANEHLPPPPPLISENTSNSQSQIVPSSRNSLGDLFVPSPESIGPTRAAAAAMFLPSASSNTHSTAPAVAARTTVPQNSRDPHPTAPSPSVPFASDNGSYVIYGGLRAAPADT